MIKQMLVLPIISLFACKPVVAEENLQQTVFELRAQVQSLTQRLEAMEKKLAEKENVEETEQNLALIPMSTNQNPDSVDNSAKVLKPSQTDSLTNSFIVPGTEMALSIGGYVKLDAIYNSVSAGGAGGANTGDQLLLAGTIPVNDPDQEQDQVTFHARQSRFWLKSLTPTAFGNLSTYLETDFFAFQAPGDERVSNSYSPRLRHVYGQLGQFLAGQTWTTFMDAQALPELNDFGGPVGRIFVRQPLLRWQQPIDRLGGLDWYFAVESPETTLTNTSGGRETPDDDRMPDLVTRLTLSRLWGSFSLSALVRNIRSDTQIKDSSYGAAVNVSGKFNFFDRDDVRFMFTYGNVLGRYSSSNLFNDGAIDANGKIHLIDIFSGFLAMRHWWNQNWRSTLAYGFSYADNPAFVSENVSKLAQSAQVNLLWSPLLRTTFGLEYTYAMRAIEKGNTGDLHRLQFSALYQF